MNGNGSLDISQIQSMGSSFDKIHFPQESSRDTIFSDTIIYWAKG